MPSTFYGGGEGTGGRRTAAGLLGAVALVTAILGIVNIADVPTFEGLNVLAGQTAFGADATLPFAGAPGAGPYKAVTKIDIKFKLGSVDITPYDAAGQIGTKPQNVKYKAFRATEIAGVTPKSLDTDKYKDTIWEHEECHWKSGDKKARENLFHTFLWYQKP